MNAPLKYLNLCGINNKGFNSHCRGTPCCLCVNWSTYRLQSIPPSPFLLSHPLLPSPSLLHSCFFFPGVHCCFRRFYQTDPFGLRYYWRKHLGSESRRAAAEVASSTFRAPALFIVSEETAAVFCRFPLATCVFLNQRLRLKTCVLWGLVWIETTSDWHSSLLISGGYLVHLSCEDWTLDSVYQEVKSSADLYFVELNITISTFLRQDTLKAVSVALKPSIRLYQLDPSR